MTETPFIGCWMGEPITDSTPRETLLEIIQYLARELEHYHQPHISRSIALGRVEMVKRGEG